VHQILGRLGGLDVAVREPIELIEVRLEEPPEGDRNRCSAQRGFFARSSLNSSDASILSGRWGRRSSGRQDVSTALGDVFSLPLYAVASNTL